MTFIRCCLCVCACLGLSVGISAAAPPVNDVWETTFVDESTRYWNSNHRTVLFDQDGVMHVFYSGYELQHAWFDDGQWHFEDADPTTTRAMDAAAAIDPAGGFHVCYRAADSYELRYAYKPAEGSWTHEVVRDTANPGYYCSIAVDSNDYPHIAHHTLASHNLEYSSWDGTQWNAEVLESGSSNDAGKGLSLAIDSLDHPHLAYGRWYYGTSVRYCTFDGAEWLFENTNLGSSLNAVSTEIVVDEDDQPHVAAQLCHSTGVDALKYAVRGETGEWTAETVTEEDVSSARRVSLLYDADGEPHIYTYRRERWREAGTWHMSDYIPRNTGVCFATNPVSGERSGIMNEEDVSYLVWYADDAWQTESIVQEVHLTLRNALAVDSLGYPHVAYYESVAEQLLYAYEAADGWHVQMAHDGPVDWFDMALGPDDEPHFIFQRGSGHIAWIGPDAAGDWQEEVIEYLVPRGKGAVTVDEAGVPHVAYDDRGSLHYAYRGEAGWVIDEVDGIYEAIEERNILIVDGAPYIVTEREHDMDPHSDLILYRYVDDDWEVIELIGRGDDPWVGHVLSRSYKHAIRSSV